MFIYLEVVAFVFHAICACIKHFIFINRQLHVQEKVEVYESNILLAMIIDEWKIKKIVLDKNIVGGSLFFSYLKFRSYIIF